MNTQNERRKNKTISQEDMYKISSLNKFIENERREDEIKKLKEVQEQKKVWIRVMIACGALNITLLILALVGYIQKG